MGFYLNKVILPIPTTKLTVVQKYGLDPEEYEPKYWEYYSHPVSRWLARYVMEDPAIGYYKNIYHLETTTRWERQTRLVGQVQEIQKLEQEGAYAWFTDPAVAGHTYEDTEEYIKGTKL